ncbi:MULTISPECIES: hypothetical protein [Acinetobacter]|jgi:hypothetical protein|uniref:Type-F conjugative transfer system protein TrbI n=2 Tax=Acinetobacter TaxID=469 RepID=N9AGT8_9GAMM|nr:MULTISPECIES: hypothetical protein [Acinetobacter]EEY94839.1 hypothetical protein HMPREF0016_03106 [Acinetobacter johnsonii SH046]ENV43283.1 hypothetical protein F955_02830 [Acinetobacter schindleri CIP 107287]MDG9798684.1 hypothetical protein [Acinetobacter johnsonii]
MSEQNDKKEDSPVEGVQKDLSQRIDEVINEDNQNKEKVEPELKTEKVSSQKVSKIDKWISGLKFVIATALISLLVTFPGLYLVKKSQVKVGVVDVQALLVEHEKKVTQQLYANQGLYQNSDAASLNSGAVEEQTKQFLLKLEGSIDDINNNCGCVLINKAALLTQSGNVVDYTQKVREALEK